MWPSGKAPGFGPGIRGFESLTPSQNCTKLEIVARMGGFFFGFAEQKPDVFRGRKRVWGSRRLRLLPPLAVFGKIQMHTNQIGRLFAWL